MVACRPELSVEATMRCGSANRSTTVPRITHRHGWLLCSEGARHANSTAPAITSVSTIVWVIALGRLLSHVDPRPCRRRTPGSLVPKDGSIDDFRLYCGRSAGQTMK